MDQLMEPARAEVSSRAVRGRRVAWRPVAFITLLVAFVLLSLAVVHRSSLLAVDSDAFRLNLRARWPHWFPFIHTYVYLGQRGPSTLVALPWFVWRAWKTRSARPLVMLATAVVVLNLSVGVVKVATGRIGPQRTENVNAVFKGGNIFPSGHTSNTIVLYGVIVMLAEGYRRTAAAVAVLVALTVGLSTIYLETHWVTDVVGGWMVGGLVLLALPTLLPFAEGVTSWAARHLVRSWRAARSRPPAAAPGPARPAVRPGAGVPVRPAGGAPARATASRSVSSSRKSAAHADV